MRLGTHAGVGKKPRTKKRRYATRQLRGAKQARSKR